MDGLFSQAFFPEMQDFLKISVHLYGFPDLPFSRISLIGCAGQCGVNVRQNFCGFTSIASALEGCLRPEGEFAWKSRQ